MSGLPCDIELDHAGIWTVTLASATYARGPDLPSTIVEASGGFVSRDAAHDLAALLQKRREVAAGG